MKKIRRKFAAIDPGFNGIRSIKNVGYLWTGMPTSGCSVAGPDKRRP
jgi:hypothetical protein